MKSSTNWAAEFCGRWTCGTASIWWSCRAGCRCPRPRSNSPNCRKSISPSRTCSITSTTCPMTNTTRRTTASRPNSSVGILTGLAPTPTSSRSGVERHHRQLEYRHCHHRYRRVDQPPRTSPPISGRIRTLPKTPRTATRAIFTAGTSITTTPTPIPIWEMAAAMTMCFHGTFVAGVAAAVSDNGIGIVGASWHSRIMPLKVFTNTGGAPVHGHCRGDPFRRRPRREHHQHELRQPRPDPDHLQSAIKYAHAQGVIMVAAAGNNNSSQRSYPASYPHVISVGGTGSGSVLSGGSAANMRARASFSEYGPKAVDVVAPAVDIVSTAVLSMTDQNNGWGQAGDSTYFVGNGTSFASPLVAGEAALLLSRGEHLGLDGSITADTIESVILNATTDLGDDPTDTPNGGAKWAGHGRVDFLAALQHDRHGTGHRAQSASEDLRERLRARCRGIGLDGQIGQRTGLPD